MWLLDISKKCGYLTSVLPYDQYVFCLSDLDIANQNSLQLEGMTDEPPWSGIN